jgi:hypothetical protein
MSPCERVDDGRHNRVEALALGGDEEDAVATGHRRRSLHLGGGWKGGEAPVDLKERHTGQSSP